MGSVDWLIVHVLTIPGSVAVGWVLGLWWARKSGQIEFKMRNGDCQ